MRWAIQSNEDTIQKIEAKRDVRDADMQTIVNSRTLLPSKDQQLAL